MRILQVSSASSFGGGERYVVDLSNALQSRGHELFAALRPMSPLTKHLHLSPDHIKTVPLRNALDPQSARALARMVNERQIAVLHAHMARDYSLAAYAARNNPDTKFFVTRHVLFPLNRLHKRTLRNVNKVIAVSGAVARQLHDQDLVPPEKIALVRNGIDVDHFANACKNFDRQSFLFSKSLPANSLLVGSIGELRKLKRHDDLVRAAAIVRRELDEAHFVIAGIDTSRGNENRQELLSLVRELGLTDRVHLLGWLSDAERLLCALDVFVSASETESFGLSIAEAMAAGTAVVSTRTEGAQELIEDKTTGLLVPIGDVEQLAGAIVGLLKNRPQRSELAQSAAVVARERFSLERMVNEIETLYFE